jgi:hypothetical protein
MASRKQTLENAVSAWLSSPDRPAWALPFAVVVDDDDTVRREDLPPVDESVQIHLRTHEITTVGIVDIRRLDAHVLVLTISGDGVSDDVSKLVEQLRQRLPSIDLGAAGRISSVELGEPFSLDAIKTQDAAVCSLTLNCEVFG